MTSDKQKGKVSRVLLIELAVLVAVWFLALHIDAVRDYLLYFFEKRPAITLRYDELSGEWTEQTLRKRFPDSDIYCSTDSSHGMGDRGCVLDVSSNRGVRTVYISFFFARGRLNAASFNIPWWAHSEGLDDIVASYGEPYGEQQEAHSGVRLSGWKLPNGSALFYNRDRDLNPLIWNSAFWNSAEWCGKGHCFMDDALSPQ
jgi:hypothetical protein